MPDGVFAPCAAVAMPNAARSHKDSLQVWMKRVFIGCLPNSVEAERECYPGGLTILVTDASPIAHSGIDTHDLSNV
jgi:hypothetical protein